MDASASTPTAASLSSELPSPRSLLADVCAAAKAAADAWAAAAAVGRGRASTAAGATLTRVGRGYLGRLHAAAVRRERTAAAAVAAAAAAAAARVAREGAARERVARALQRRWRGARSRASRADHGARAAFLAAAEAAGSALAAAAREAAAARAAGACAADRAARAVAAAASLHHLASTAAVRGVLQPVGAPPPTIGGMPVEELMRAAMTARVRAAAGSAASALRPRTPTLPYVRGGRGVAPYSAPHEADAARTRLSTLARLDARPFLAGGRCAATLAPAPAPDEPGGDVFVEPWRRRVAAKDLPSADTAAAITSRRMRGWQAASAARVVSRPASAATARSSSAARPPQSLLASTPGRPRSAAPPFVAAPVVGGLFEDRERQRLKRVVG